MCCSGMCPCVTYNTYTYVAMIYNKLEEAVTQSPQRDCIYIDVT